ncbi:MAG: sugar phosphate isomerase/epimerase [Anaerolineae bacterium]|nr:sugar phosphate isomerase/epimerase [Anaerolineae bacterium]
MRLGISSWTYAWAVGVPDRPPHRPLRPTDLLDRAAKLGVRVVQICDNLSLSALSPGELSELERWAAALGITIELGTRGTNRATLQGYLRLAERLKAPLLRLVPDTQTHHPSEDEIVASLREIAPDLERAHVCLAIENHDRFKARTLARIIERIGSRAVGVCLDAANSFGSLEGPETVLDVLGPLAMNLHVKDFVVQRASHGMGFVIEGRPAGQGQLNIPWLLQALGDREISAILELWTPPESRLSATIAKEEAWAVSSITYLRQLIPQ